MPSILDVLDTVDGLRDDTERRLAEQFPTVASLSAASRSDLEQVKGVGQVLSGRILMAAARAQETMSDPEAATRQIKDSTAAGMAIATEVIDAAGKVVGKVASGSQTASQAVRDAEIAAKTGIYRLHAKSDDAIDRTAETVGPAAMTAKAVADKAMGTARGAAGKVAGAAGDVGKAATKPARKVIDGVRGQQAGSAATSSGARDTGDGDAEAGDEDRAGADE